MPARESYAGRKRRGRPARRRQSARLHSEDDDTTSATDRVDDDAGFTPEETKDPESDHEVVPRIRLTKRPRGRPPKRAITPLEDHDSKRRTEDAAHASETPATVALDEAGEKKIDQDGHLLGGREYRVPTFTIPTRGNQLFMFALEPARVLHYRDSYLLFQRNPTLERIRLTEDERNNLVKRKLLIHWFRNRDVAVVSARSCFMHFGAKMIKNGRRVLDDYYEERARQEGYTEDMPVSGDEDEEKTGRRTLISRSSRSTGYDPLTPVNSATWMHHAALAVRGFNAQLHERRSEKNVFFDVHTNVNQIASATQPTACRFECVDTSKDFSIAPVDFAASNAVTTTFRGIGKDILDGTVDTNAALAALPESIREQAKEVLAGNQPKIETFAKEDDKYPLALYDGQFQSSFPVHFTRFNQPNPRITAPSAIQATVQAYVAQHQYINQMYQAMGQNMEPFMDPNARPSAPIQARSPGHSSPRQARTPQAPPMMAPPQQPQQPAIIQSIPAPIHCGAPMPGKHTCKQIVSVPGQRCHNHSQQPPPPQQPPQNRSIKPTPPPAGVKMPSVLHQAGLGDNTCAECHYLSAPSDVAPKPEVYSSFGLIKCAKCTRKYHPACAHLKTPRQVAAVESYPWACPECKVCCVCKDAGDESTLLICDGCDRGWHTGCCNPKVKNVPEGNWLCPLCAACHNCDARGDKVEFRHAIAPPTDKCRYPVYLATYDQKCYDNFENDRFCPVCLKTFSGDENDEEDNDMVACDACDRWIHTACDETLTPDKYQALCDDETAKYTCPLCAGNVKPLEQTSEAALALRGNGPPAGHCIGLLGGKFRTRGVVLYKKHNVGVPELNGAGVEDVRL